MLSKLIRIENRAGEIVEAGGFKIRPFSQVVIIRFPILPGGLVWNRPFSVLATDAYGQEEVIPIPDPTRIAQIALLFAFLAFPFLFWLSGRRMR